MAKRGPKPQSRTSTADAVMWVMEHFDEPNEVVGDMDGMTRYLWFHAHDYPDKFFDKHVPKAILVKEAAGGDQQKQQVQRDSEEHLGHLKGRLGELLKGTELEYCQKCWVEIKSGEGVRVVQ